MSKMPELDRWGRLPPWMWRGAFALILLLQAAFGLQGIANDWMLGHHGFNGAAYHLAARNSLRWEILFPVQYLTGGLQPTPDHYYTHAPLALHLHTVASVLLLGDHEYAVRAVPALMGLLAAAALFWVVRRLWSDAHAVLAASLYVLLPINHGFANMTNHSTGAILWSLLALYAYLRWISSPDLPKKWLALTFASGLFAMQWDWPAYYIAFTIALHWAWTAASQPAQRPLAPLLKPLALWCAATLASFGGFFLLVYLSVGHFNEIKTSVAVRTSSIPDVYTFLWERALLPMFPWPLLALAAAWLVAWLIRLPQGRALPRDLVILSFGFAGLMHLLLFKNSAMIHIYWNWQFNPFIAIAASVALLAPLKAAHHLSTRLPWSPELQQAVFAVASALLLFHPLLHTLLHTLPLIPELRRVAGAYGTQNYNSDLLRVLFAHQVHAWTSPDTGLLYHTSFLQTVESLPAFDRTRDLPSERFGHPHLLSSPDLPTLQAQPPDGWVVLGTVRATPRKELLRAASKHPFKQFGLYYMVDRRTSGQDIQIWNLLPSRPTLAHRFFVNAFDPLYTPHRDPRAEQALRNEIAKLPPPHPDPPQPSPEPPQTPQEVPSLQPPVSPSDKTLD